METELASFKSSAIHGTGGYARREIASGTRNPGLANGQAFARQTICL